VNVRYALTMKPTIHVALSAAVLIVVALLADAWRVARRDSAHLAATLAAQNTAIQQAGDRQKQRDTQLAAALATIQAQKRSVQTPQQAAKELPSILPELPLPISIRIPNLSMPLPPAEAPPASIIVPQIDLKPLYDDLQDCRSKALESDTLKKDLVDEKLRSTGLIQERNAAIAAARGGTLWPRIKRSAKWFAIGAAAGAIATLIAHKQHPNAP
jgi:hypothetical protein